MSNAPSSSQPIVTFLRYLADSLELNTLTPSRRKSVAEFYMAWQLQTEMPHETEEPKPEDYFKYMVMGWWIYNSMSPASPEIPPVD